MGCVIFFLKKYYFNIFLNKKYFEKQPLSQDQTLPTLYIAIHVLNMLNVIIIKGFLSKPHIHS
jgi:hypothetical protein